MPDKYKTENEPVYQISVAAQLMGISVHTLRMYENKGLIIPYKTENNRRLYSDSDVLRVLKIRKDIQERKLNIHSIRTLSALIPCWLIVKCSDEERSNCPAFNQHDNPCWTYKHSGNPCETNECRECAVYNINTDAEKIKETIVKYGTQQ